MRTCALVFVAAGMVLWAVAGEPAERQPAPAPTARAEPAPAAAQPTASSDDALVQQEQSARVDAALALTRLELILSRKALHDRRFELAARKALHVQNLLKQVPPDVDVGEYELQAEGVLARAQHAGVNVEALRRDAAAAAEAKLPPRKDDPKLDAKLREAAGLSRNYTGSASSDIDQQASERVLRERTLRRQKAGVDGYHPAEEVVNKDALRVRDAERNYYQGALDDAGKDSEAQALVEVDESRVIPHGEISYPPNWPEKMKKRQQYAGGLIARTPSWVDKDGREWYIGLYDIHDLIYVPPDFTAPQFNPLFAQRDAEDRAALRWQSQIFRGWPEDLAAGIPLLRFFGGVNDWEFRGPKYSVERQNYIVEMIKQFTAPQDATPKVIPIPP